MRYLGTWRGQAAAGAAILALGAAGGVVAGHAFRPAAVMAPLHIVSIRSLPTQSGIVSVRARVAETYGNKFVADDGSGRTLVDLGRAGDEQALVADRQTVTVQGRFDHGILHAAFLVDAGGAVRDLGPAGPPPHGPDRPDGPPRGPAAPPPRG